MLDDYIDLIPEHYRNLARMAMEDLRKEISKEISSAIEARLNEAIPRLENSILEQLSNFNDRIPSLIDSAVEKKVAGLLEGIKVEMEKKGRELIQLNENEVAKSKKGNPNSEAKSEVGEKIVLKLIDKLLGSSEEEVERAISKFVRMKQLENQIAQSLGFIQPSHDLLFDAYRDAYSKAFAYMLRHGRFPFTPISLEEAKKRGLFPGEKPKNSSNSSSLPKGSPGDIKGSLDIKDLYRR